MACCALLPAPLPAARRRAAPSDIARLEALLRDAGAIVAQLYGTIRENVSGQWQDAELVMIRPRLMDFGLRLGQLYTGRYKAIGTIDDYVKLRNKLVADGNLRVLEQLDLQDAWTAIAASLSTVLRELIVFLADTDDSHPGILASPIFTRLRKAADRQAPLVPAQAPPVDGKRFAQLEAVVDAYHELRFNIAGTARLAAGYRPVGSGR